jgi:mono/diheme cytochrome c family protein
MKSIVTAVLAAAAFVALTSPIASQELGNAKRGEAMAKSVCAECHAVEKGEGGSPNGNAPRFQTLAAARGMTPMAFTVALRTSHREMPNLVLKDREVDDLIAYFATLK